MSCANKYVSKRMSIRTWPTVLHTSQGTIMDSSALIVNTREWELLERNKVAVNAGVEMAKGWTSAERTSRNGKGTNIC